MVVFERRLWSLARNYHALAQQSPRTLVDVSRIVEMQEQVGGTRRADFSGAVFVCGSSLLSSPSLPVTDSQV